VTDHRVVASRNLFEDGDFERIDWDDHEIVQCQNCGSPSFRHAHRDTENEEPDSGQPAETVVIYPPRTERRRLITSLLELPWPLRDTFHETTAALDEGKVRLPAIGIRACIEQICIERGVTAGNLKAKINALATAGHVTVEEAGYLHAVREDVGNTGAHELFVASRQQLDAAMHVLEALIHRLYLLPHVAEEVRKPTIRGGPSDETA
jgi:hypothetical protein